LADMDPMWQPKDKDKPSYDIKRLYVIRALFIWLLISSICVCITNVILSSTQFKPWIDLLGTPAALIAFGATMAVYSYSIYSSGSLYDNSATGYASRTFRRWTFWCGLGFFMAASLGAIVVGLVVLAIRIYR
jgi:hypothetical protein